MPSKRKPVNKRSDFNGRIRRHLAKAKEITPEEVPELWVARVVLQNLSVFSLDKVDDGYDLVFHMENESSKFVVSFRAPEDVDLKVTQVGI